MDKRLGRYDLDTRDRGGKPTLASAKAVRMALW